MPLVSVVIAAFNAAKTIDEAIKSVINQSVSDWELVIFDDRSDDATALIARTWAERDPRIRLISGNGGGAAAARNLGARRAKGAFLLFLDSDDLIQPQCLELLLNAASTRPNLGAIYGKGARLAPDGRIGQPEGPAEGDLFRQFGSHNPLYTHACLLKRSVFEEFGGFDPNLKTCEDWDLWQRLTRAGVDFCPIADCIALYRIRPTSLSHNALLVLDDARTVITRGHGRDPRVSRATSANANGLSAAELPQDLLGIALWCVALMIGAGKDPSPILQHPELQKMDCPIEAHVDHYVAMLLGGVPNGACMLQRDWPALLPKVEHSIQRALSIIGAALGNHNFEARCMDELLHRVAQISELNKQSPVPNDERLAQNSVPSVGSFQFGDFDRGKPVSQHWGYDRGDPIDRKYIEEFLEEHAADIQGRALEVGDNSYTLRFGGERVIASDVLHIDVSAPGATIIADLANAENIGSFLFDCIILTQTLQYVSNLQAAVRTLHRILKPGGVLLLTVPGMPPIDHDRWEASRFWSFTEAGLRNLLSAEFPHYAIAVESRGNVFAAAAFLQGLAQQELPDRALGLHDPHYPVTVLARAVKSGGVPEQGGVDRSVLAHQSLVATRFVEELKQPRAASVMVVVAHPDDELIGAAGHLALWPDLKVVHVTTGSPRNPEYAKHAGYADTLHYAAARRHEAEEALALIALAPDRIINLGIDDQDTSFRLIETTRRILRLFSETRPAVVITHAYEGGHPDHDAVCFAVHNACQILFESGLASPAIVELSSYFGRDGIRVTSSFLTARPPAKIVQLDASTRELKRRMLDCHRSQGKLLDLFPDGVECFRAAPRYDFSRPCHDGPLFYEFHDLGIRGSQWRELAIAALEEFRLAAPRGDRHRI